MAETFTHSSSDIIGGSHNAQFVGESGNISSGNAAPNIVQDYAALNKTAPTDAQKIQQMQQAFQNPQHFADIIKAGVPTTQSQAAYQNQVAQNIPMNFQSPDYFAAVMAKAIPQTQEQAVDYRLRHEPHRE